jgi:hypothetical protein
MRDAGNKRERDHLTNDAPPNTLIHTTTPINPTLAHHQSSETRPERGSKKEEAWLAARLASEGGLPQRHTSITGGHEERPAVSGRTTFDAFHRMVAKAPLTSRCKESSVV